MKKLYLVDVSNMFFRAYYAIPPLNNSAGLPTNALYGFLAMTVKLLRDINPDYLVYCFDRKEPSFRADLYPEYKANRSEMPEDLVPQMPYIRKLTQLMGIKDLDQEGFEADDVIGTLTKLGRKNNLEVVIVSGDKDFAQLVEPKVTLYDTMKEVKYDPQGVAEKWGINPDQIIDYLAIVGDSSDNIPGVKGVGPKGAQKLLAEYKTLDGVYKNIEKITAKSQKQKLIDGKESAYLAQKLVTIINDIKLGATIDDLKLKPIEKTELEKVLLELEFDSFARKLFGGESPMAAKKESAKKEISPAEKSKKKSPKSAQKDAPTELVKWSVKDLKKNLPAYADIRVFLNERGLCVASDGKRALIDGSLEEMGPLFDEKMVSWRGYDLKKVWRSLKVKDPQTPESDQMLEAYVIRPGNVESFEKVYQAYTGKLVLDLAGPEDMLLASLELEPLLHKKLEEVDQAGVLKKLELPLVPVLHKMETNGIKLDVEELKEQSKGLTKDLASLEKKVHKEAGESFNVASTKQLAEILFTKMGIEPIKKIKTGYSTDSDVLSQLADEHPIAKHVLEFRELAKLKSTYVDALPELVNKETGRIHTQLRQAVTTTGRLSSVNPNLQNIPVRTERGRLVRKAFVAPKGHVLLSADYSQIELRVLAHITEDPGLLKAFKDDLDIHKATASLVFNTALDEVTSEQRRLAKAVNFGIAYGQGPFGLAQSLGISRTEASEIIGNYFGRFRKVQQYMESIVESAKANGYVTTLFGRRRYIDELKAKNANLRAFGERAAINAPIQGTASDLVKKAMIDIYDEISIPMLLQVHDELLFESPKKEVEEQADQIKEIMENATTLKVPLKVNIAWGTNWEDAHP